MESEEIDFGMECEEIDFEDVNTFRNVSWSIEGIVVTIIGVIGILTNFIAIPITHFMFSRDEIHF